MNAPDTPTRKKPLRWAWIVVPPVIVLMMLVVFCGPTLLRQVIVRRLESLGATVIYFDANTGTWFYQPSGFDRWRFDVKAVRAERPRLKATALSEIVQGARQIDSTLSVELILTGTLQQDLGDLADARKLDLSLTGHQLSAKSLQQLGLITGTQSLDLSGCSFDNRNLVALKTLQGLRVLHLDNSSINDDGLQHLQGLKQLLSVTVSNTQVSDSAKEALSRSLPEMNLSDD